jgi:hypothetical protein
MSRWLCPLYNLNGSADSSVGIGTGCQFEVPGLILSSATFSVPYNVQTGSRARPAPYPMGTEVSILGGKAADHSSPSSVETRNGGGISPLHHMFLWQGA